MRQQSPGFVNATHRASGHIEWDESQDEHMPLVVIDGGEVSWHDLGRMLTTTEGWQFRLDITDPSEELWPVRC
jgi:hypothetical protein